MSNIYQLRELLRTQTIYDLPLRVAYYARVSTDHDEQKTSIKNQDDYFKELIKSKPNWKFMGGYIDEGISGIAVKKREDFLRMIDDAKNGKIDLILTKEISRFARNTLDSIKYTRELLACGVCVWFMNDGINTIDEDSELRLTIMAAMAQDEIRKMSSRIKFGQAQSIKNGVVMGNSRLYGYDKKDGKLIINESEAEMVRFIFESYASGKWTTPQIERYLYEKGYRNYNGGKINRGVIKNIIKNPKYKGYYAGGKVKVIDMFTKKQMFLPKDQWVYYKDDGSTVPQIIDEKTWEDANYYMKSRGDNIRSHRTVFKYGNVFTGKVICGIDGASYWLREHKIRGKESDPRWVCSHKIKNGANSCLSVPVRESDLKQMVASAISQAAGNSKDVIDSYMNYYLKAIDDSKEKEGEIAVLRKNIESTKLKMEKILDYNLNGSISDDEFLKRNAAYKKEIENAEEKILKLSKKPEEPDSIARKIEQIREYLANTEIVSANDITKQIVEKLIEKIVILPEEENGMKVIKSEIYLINKELYKFCKEMGTKTSCSDNVTLIMFPKQRMEITNENAHCVNQYKRFSIEFSLFVRF